MVHRIKVRVSLRSGKAQKLSFDIEEGKTLRLHGEAPGLAILAALVGDPQQTVCRLTLREGVLEIRASSSGGPLQLNGHKTQESLLVQGDRLDFDLGSIEFLEVPVPPSPQDAADRTRYVSLEESEATRVMSNSESTRTIASPLVLESASASEAVNQADGATGSIMRQKGPAPAKRDDITAAIMRQKGPAPERRDDITGAIMRHHTSAETTGKIKRSLTSLITSDDIPTWKHIGISLVMIGVSSEIASLIAFGFKLDFSPIPSPLFGLGTIALLSAISGAFTFWNRLWEGESPFKSYLRSFGWFSLTLLPYSLAWGFPKSVILFASALLATLWIFGFSLRHFDRAPRFVPISASTWLALILAGNLAMPRVVPLLLARGHGDANREIASETAPASVAETQAAGVPLASVTAPSPMPSPSAPVAAIPVAPVAPDPTAASNTATALDPMAVEQFFNAIRSGDLDTVRSMVDRHIVDPVFTLHNGSSALHLAAARGDYKIVKYLISKRVNIDAQDAGGTTPLMWATYRRHEKIVRYLISKKARLDIQREGGDTAIDIAKKNRDRHLVSVLESAAASRSIAGHRSSHHSKSKSKSKSKSRSKRTREPDFIDPLEAVSNGGRR